MKNNLRSLLSELKIAVVLLLSLGLWSCGGQDYGALPLEGKSGGLNVVVEIPAGTNGLASYNGATGMFEKSGSLSFLPFPGNYGFIAGTTDGENGGDGNGVDVLVLSESVPAGTVIEVLPIGLIQVMENGGVAQKVVAVPADAAKRTIDATAYNELSAEVIYILELWFQNHQGTNALEILGWKNESAAKSEIEKRKRA